MRPPAAARREPKPPPRPSTELRLRPAQYRAARDKAAELVVGAAGGRCGASYLLRVLALREAARLSDAEVVLAGPAVEDVRDIHLYGPRGLLALVGDLEHHGAATLEAGGVRFANGSRLRWSGLRSGPELDRLLLRPPEILLVDEADQVEPALLERLRSRVLSSQRGRLISASRAEPWPGPAWTNGVSRVELPREEVADLAEAPTDGAGEGEWPAGLSPQEGPQSAFLGSDADVTIFGGSAGGGKTYGLLLDPLRERGHPAFAEVIFRRTYRNVMRVDGLWDVAGRLYRPLGAEPRKSEYTYEFPSGARVIFGHLEHEKTLEDWKGAQPARIGFDQLEEFQEAMFFYMFSRLRSAAGIRPLLRATCNPDAESWLVHGRDGWGSGFISWWIDPETGYPIPERDGVVRWFARGSDDRIIWGATPEEVRELTGREDALPKSATFIRSRLEDNPALTEADPGYRANLELLPRVERERLLGGNWKIRREGGDVFDADVIPVSREHPGLVVDEDGRELDPVMESCLAWDYAGSAKGDKTAAVRADRLRSDRVVLWPRFEDQLPTRQVKHSIVRATRREPKTVLIYFPQDPGGSGKIVAADVEDEVKAGGYRFKSERVTGSKLSRATPLSAACQPVRDGELPRVVIYDDGSGLADRLLTVLHNFTGEEGGDDDLVDAAADAFNEVDRPRKRLQVG